MVSMNYLIFHIMFGRGEVQNLTKSTTIACCTTSGPPYDVQKTEEAAVPQQ